MGQVKSTFIAIVALAVFRVYSQGVIGSIFVHDPVLIKQGNMYHVFYTGPRVMHIKSALRYGTNWGAANSIFSTLPSWISSIEGFSGNDLWAPDISFRDNKYWLYYSASSFGSRNSGIGLATTPTLDQSSGDYKWTDQGMVIRTYQSGSKYNAIDPNAFEDTDGTLWLVFGSFQPEGIQLVQLNTSTGKIAALATPQTIAKRSNQAIEAPFLVKWEKWYYLFVSWDACCKGASSTYKIVVGRSSKVTGPYIDKSGADMKNGGGVILDQSTNEWKGPGHNGIFIENDTMFCINHAYKATTGTATMFIRPLYWNNEWPQFQYVPPVTTIGQSRIKPSCRAVQTRLVLSTTRGRTSLIATNGSAFFTITGAEIRNFFCK
ncbi:MAG TPA: arabinan endo-1,5-alpha-L-arabinosidase [Chitinispirillaceae bacterium]|nr:arabinan endo-1,5-alpha-L-arabinosidase [Chitinispirillaceae bacterium]